MKVLVLNASLKHGKDLSNTEEVTNLVLDAMRAHGEVDDETIRLSDKNIPVGLGFRESKDDEWPEIADKLRAADIVIFATPIWWGHRSSPKTDRERRLKNPAVHDMAKNTGCYLMYGAKLLKEHPLAQ